MRRKRTSCGKGVASLQISTRSGEEVVGGDGGEVEDGVVEDDAVADGVPGRELVDGDVEGGRVGALGDEVVVEEREHLLTHALVLPTCDTLYLLYRFCC